MTHVLIIEDSDLFSRVVGDIVTVAGATSYSIAHTEPAAIVAANARKPGLILSDVMLLDGKGPEAVQAIVTAHGFIPVIFVTGSPDECARFPGASIVLEKPVTANRLIEAIKPFLEPVYEQCDAA